MKLLPVSTKVWFKDKEGKQRIGYARNPKGKRQQVTHWSDDGNHLILHWIDEIDIIKTDVDIQGPAILSNLLSL